MGGFQSANNALVIPKQLGVEFAPALLIAGSKLSAREYNENKVLYSTRLSGASGRDSLGHGQLAIGLRLSLKDGQDMRRLGAGGTDTVVTRYLTALTDIYDAANDKGGPGKFPLTADQTAQIKALTDTIKQYWADHYWNATSFDVAFGARASTLDTLGHDPKIDELTAWITYANSLQGWGQFLVGGKFGTARDTLGAFHGANTVAARLYVGTNDLKGYVEGQHALWSTTEAPWMLDGGVEVKVASIGWINASAGYAAGPSGGKPQLISSFTFKTALLGL